MYVVHLSNVRVSIMCLSIIISLILKIEFLNNNISYNIQYIISIIKTHNKTFLQSEFKHIRLLYVNSLCSLESSIKYMFFISNSFYHFKFFQQHNTTKYPFNSTESIFIWNLYLPTNPTLLSQSIYFVMGIKINPFFWRRFHFSWV